MKQSLIRLACYGTDIGLKFLDFLGIFAVASIVAIVFFSSIMLFAAAIPLVLGNVVCFFEGDELTQVIVTLCYYLVAYLFFAPYIFGSSRREFYIHP
ncbi:MAG: hypothetical protein UX49_C0028G0004 [Candidatus Wolfebacteria bacterium GW2011_GWC2_46_275]|nr:MAG: hypothetical protein UX49_C0028G0004 [Candidatus Wolfebacteria bacterium GW2011_GWC2_46_275]KKU53407.1 MAG: hypothetical protein UX76_C0017G0004 [Candidatus Wolfebacteria bacterium GW2011_GWC1_47_103]KKU70914.1 MAG: hypothetical protein UX96_C0032G0004 [Candidatus Wolfebacteria bacterium GW2011_GWB1_47_243]KKU76886.1 MAG: hypothetical protein UY00_C0001G0021 [Candidatus Wolfebacteria bacterium GW2011_GWA1_47_6]HCM53313.1 hypothetical protein [Candidatus Wolfebacteria bacterium]